MINCPKCNELISEEHVMCPICRYEFSIQDIINIKKELSDRENKRFYYRKELREEAAKKRSRYFSAMMLSLFVPALVGLVLTLLTGSIIFVEILASLGLVCEIINVIVAQIKGVFRCPFCDGTLYRYYGSYCPHCGEKI